MVCEVEADKRGSKSRTAAPPAGQLHMEAGPSGVQPCVVGLARELPAVCVPARAAKLERGGSRRGLLQTMVGVRRAAAARSQ